MEIIYDTQYERNTTAFPLTIYPSGKWRESCMIHKEI